MKNNFIIELKGTTKILLPAPNKSIPSIIISRRKIK
jgi:hypothetical protein